MRCLLALVVWAAATSAAQEEPLVRVDTRLVQVDVVVRSKSGPAAGLQQSDFTVFDQGKRQQIATFAVRSARDTAGNWTLLPAHAVSNRLDDLGTEPVGATVILLDYLNTAPDDQSRAIQELRKYLASAPPGNRIAIYTLNKTLRIARDFTVDRESLARTAETVRAEKSVDEGAADLVSDLPVTGDAMADAMIRNAAAEMTDRAMRNRAEITAYALGLTGKHLMGLPGRKKIVWISAAFPASYTYTGQRNGRTQIETRTFGEEIDDAVHTLNDANVAVYPIDPRPLSSDGLLLPGIDTMNLLAGGTGGVAQYAINDIAGALQTAFADSEVTYSLGFYPSPDKLDGSYHSIRVQVARSGVEIRHRKGYLASNARPPSEKARQASLNEVFTTPLEATDLGLTALAQPDPAKRGSYILHLALNVNELHLEREKDRWVALLSIATKFPARKAPNGTLENIKISLTEERLKDSLRAGYILRRPYLAGDLHGELRVVVQDRVTGLAGSVRLAIGN